MEDKDDEEYRKRIKDLVDKLEKDKDSPATEQDVIEAKARLLQTAISKIHPLIRNEGIIFVFIYTIRDYYYKRRADPTKKNQFQEEIDNLYKLIYEELRKSSPFISNFNLKKTNPVDLADRKRILKKMVIILGLENIFRDFYKYYRINDILRPYNCTREIIWYIIGIVGFTVVVIILMSFGLLKVPYS